MRPVVVVGIDPKRSGGGGMVDVLQVVASINQCTSRLYRASLTDDEHLLAARSSGTWSNDESDGGLSTPSYGGTWGGAYSLGGSGPNPVVDLVADQAPSAVGPHGASELTGGL